MSTIRILSGSYRNQAVRNEVFTLVKGFQTGKKGNYVTVKNDGQFPGFGDEVKIKVATMQAIEFLNGSPVVATEVPVDIPTESEEDAMDRIAGRFAVLDGERQAARLLERHLAEGHGLPETIAIVLWGTDNLKTEGGPIGQVLALLGENGAGKSTLIRVLGGAQPADSGSLLLDGRPVRFRTPQEARAAGVAVMHQEFSLVPGLDAAENIFLGQESSRVGFLPRAEERSRARELCDRLGVRVDLDRAREILLKVTTPYGSWLNLSRHH